MENHKPNIIRRTGDLFSIKAVVVFTETKAVQVVEERLFSGEGRFICQIFIYTPKNTIKVEAFGPKMDMNNPPSCKPDLAIYEALKIAGIQIQGEHKSTDEILLDIAAEAGYPDAKILTIIP
mgnify:FL=1